MTKSRRTASSRASHSCMRSRTTSTSSTTKAHGTSATASRAKSSGWGESKGYRDYLKEAGYPDETADAFAEACGSIARTPSRTIGTEALPDPGSKTGEQLRGSPAATGALFTYAMCRDAATTYGIGRRGRRPDWMDEMGKQRKAFSVCIGNYGYYAEGELRDRRIALPASRAEFRDFLEKSGLQDPMHEEIYVSDYESVPFGLNSLFGENREYRPA